MIPYHFAVYLDDFGRVQCNWGEGTDVASYAIYRAMGYQAPLPGEAEPIWQGPSDASSFLDTEVLLPGRYTYRLVAFGADGAYDSKADGVVIGDNVFGTVVGPAGQPLPGIEVAMFPRALQIDPSVVPALTLVTDSAGGFSCRLDGGGYYLRYRDPAGIHMEEWYGGAHYLRYNDYIHIYGDDAMVFPEVQLDRKTCVSGTAMSSFTRQPLAGVRVLLQQIRHDTSPPGGTYTRNVTEILTDPDGTYTMLMDAGDEYRLEFSGADHVTTSTALFSMVPGQQSWGGRVDDAVVRPCPARHDAHGDRSMEAGARAGLVPGH